MQRNAYASDGRVQRGERSRDAIVQALFELIAEGSLSPTAEAVAERASVGIRTVFRHFSDMESLFAALDERVTASARSITANGTPTGDVDQRAIELVERRASLYEMLAPFERSANLKRYRSPFLQDRHRRFIRELRKDLERWIPELSAAPDDVQQGLDCATSIEVWDRLRIEQRLSRKRAQEAMECTVLSLVANLA